MNINIGQAAYFLLANKVTVKNVTGIVTVIGVAKVGWDELSCESETVYYTFGNYITVESKYVFPTLDALKDSLTEPVLE